jgi:hypothetical protein
MGIPVVLGYVEEAFIIKSEAIFFVGALVEVKNGETAVTGRVRFGNSEVLGFQSDPGQRSVLRDKLMSMCQGISGFYRTKVIHKTFPKRMENTKPPFSTGKEAFSMN